MRQITNIFSNNNYNLKNSLCLLRPLEIVWSLLMCVFVQQFLSWWYVKVPLFQNCHFEDCYGVFGEAEMLWCHFVLVLTPHVKFVCINSFAQSLSGLSSIESRGALLADDGIYHIGGRACKGTSNSLCVYLLALLG